MFVRFLLSGKNLEGNIGKRGSKAKKAIEGDLPGTIVPLTTTERKRLQEHGSLAVGSIRGREAWDREHIDLIMDRMAEATQASYSSQFKWWELFCRARRTTPFRVVTKHNREREERLFLDFVVYSASEKLWAPGTLKMRLSAIAARHTAAGFENPEVFGIPGVCFRLRLSLHALTSSFFGW